MSRHVSQCKTDVDGFKYSKECDVELCIYGAGTDANKFDKKVSGVMRNYVCGYSMFSLCELSCERRNEYYINRIFADSHGNDQCLLCGPTNKFSPNTTHSYRVLVLFPLENYHIGRRISAKRLNGSVNVVTRTIQ
jgi:hypothetical protein